MCYNGRKTVNTLPLVMNQPEPSDMKLL